MELVFLLLFAVLAAVILRISIEKVLPVIIMGSTLIVYVFALILRVVGINDGAGSLPLAVNLMLIAIGSILAGCFAVLNLRRNPAGDSSEKSHAAGLFTNNLRQYVLTPQLLIYAVVVATVLILLGGHKVMHWDDLSYWGTYVRTLLCIDKIPSGLENCTIDYKDYTPIQQILQYVILHRFTSYDEANLFRINVVFLYTVMLPLLTHTDFAKSHNPGDTSDKKVLKNVIVILSYVIFPHLISTQFYYKLGVDYLIAVLFGYILCTIVDEDERFKLIRIATASSYLALIKTSGAVLSLFAALFYCVYRYEAKEKAALKIKNDLMNFVSTFLLPVLAYCSWKIWGKISGNHGYLSDRVSTNVFGLNLVFPEYSKEVVLHYLKNVVIYPLTREKVGMTALVVIVLIAVIFHVLFGLDVKAGEGDKAKRYRRLHIWMCAGLFVFCCSHCYLYLAVFDEWEAHGLLEFDRYIIQYLGGMFFFYVWRMMKEYGRMKKIIPIAFAVVAVALFPYPTFVQYMVPSNYEKLYTSEFKGFSDNALAEWDEVKESFEKLEWSPSEDMRVGFIANAWSDELEFLVYDMVPQPVSFVFNTPAIAQGALESFIRHQLYDKNIHYVYIMKNASESHADEWDEQTSLLTDNGEPLVPGRIYVSPEKNDENWKLRLVK